jgi:hypothetical protein
MDGSEFWGETIGREVFIFESGGGERKQREIRAGLLVDFEYRVGEHRTMTFYVHCVSRLCNRARFLPYAMCPRRGDNEETLRRR